MNTGKLPVRAKRESVHVEISSGIMDLVRREAKRRKLTIRQIVEYGLVQFIEEAEREKL